MKTFSTTPEQCLYTTLWNLKCSSRMCNHWVVTERNSRIYLKSTVACNRVRFESSWLQCVGLLQEKVLQNTHHWSERTDTATEHGVGQAGSYIVIAAAIRQWRRRFTVNKKVYCWVFQRCYNSRSVMRVLYNFSYNIFFHTTLSTGFKSGEFGDHSRGRINSGVSYSINSMRVCAQWEFQISQGSV